MAKIIRERNKAHGGVAQEEKRRMAEHAKLWISRAMRTEPIDPAKIIPAIEGIYAAANLKKPRVIIVPSPLVMAFAYGASAALWHERKNGSYAATDAATRAATYAATDAATYAATDAATRAATRDATRAATYAATDVATDVATYDATDAATRAATYAATYAATDAATDVATYAATYDATYAATRAATDAATYAATRDATYDATYAATYAANDAATRAATYAATYDATRAATRAATDAATRDAKGTPEEQAAEACLNIAGKLGIECARRWSAVYQGGNMWAGYDCYLTACRDILGLELREHAAYAHWEQAAIHGGFRVMHEEFCIVSDFPELIKVDEQNRPHCETGPSHRWRDGWSLYHWHGVKIPAEWIEDKSSLDAKTALTWQNIEQRRAALEIVGWGNVLRELKAKVIDEHPDPACGSLVEVQLPDLDKPSRFIRAQCGTKREFAIGVPPEIKTVVAAQAWLTGLPESQFEFPSIRT